VSGSLIFTDVTNSRPSEWERKVIKDLPILRNTLQALDAILMEYRVLDTGILLMKVIF
jgi:hypothetical protein